MGIVPVPFEAVSRWTLGRPFEALELPNTNLSDCHQESTKVFVPDTNAARSNAPLELGTAKPSFP
jgi:hypothetical protein